MKLVVVLGVSHYYQLGPPSCTENEAENFRAKLRELLSRYSIELLAEEFHLDFLEGRAETVCRAVSDEMGTDHAYVDFSKEQRNERRILGPQDVQIMTLTGQIRQEEATWELSRSLNLRELHWVSEVLVRNQLPVLLVVGSKHVQSVVEKAKICGIDAVVESEVWKAD